MRRVITKRFARAFGLALLAKLGLAKAAWMVFVFCAATAIVSQATTTFTTLASFDGTDGSQPLYMAPVQGIDGNFYGTTSEGGANGYGTVFKITPSGTLTTLYGFCSQPNCADGQLPYGGLVLAPNGNFYGTTYEGGANCLDEEGCGTVFQITPAGTLTTLYTFCSQAGCADGAHPYAGLALATNGDFYGTTEAAGAHLNGTVFKITPSGTLTTLYSFCSQPNCADGAEPHAGLVQATNGNLYGTTTDGGLADAGTVFEVTAAGKLTTLHSFCSQAGCTDGQTPLGGLVQAANGNFYGTTSVGGANSYGTVFQITAGGTLTTLHSFDLTDGAYPYAGLAQATDGNFYGTTEGGGADGGGTIFEITAAGTLTTLYSFCSQSGCTDGEIPLGELLQATNGNFYGTTGGGGDNGAGTVFSLSVGLVPLVETLPTSGKVGAKVIILGNNLKGSTNVTFNGTAAEFSVVSNTEIKTSVPAGATTGFVTVTTPNKELQSNVVFRVTK